MRKSIMVVLVGIVVLAGLSQCRNKANEKLVGVWQLEEMGVNGAVLKGSSLGNWLWEFNEAGGYLSDVAGMREKGIYTLKDSLLTLKITTVKDRAEQVYKIAKLDSTQLDLVSTDQNRSTLRFIKRKISEVNRGEKD